MAKPHASSGRCSYARATTRGIAWGSRALAWGGQAREAEQQLRLLAARHYASAAVDSMLRAVRQEYEPHAGEAAGWVEQDPTYAPYRLALARALTREGHGALAAAQYDMLMAQAGTPPIPTASALVSEKAQAYAAAGVPDLGIGVLRDALTLSPADTALRHTLAMLLRDDHQVGEALAQYDTLLETAPTAALYRERADLHLQRREADLAELDLRTSAALVPTASAFVMLGNVQRDAGDYAAASASYRSAAALPALDGADRREIAAARAQLAREERPPVALVPIVGEEPGWRVASEASSDNLGLRYATTSVRRGMELGHELIAGLGVEGRTLGEYSVGGTTQSSGFGIDAGLSHALVFGPMLLRSAVQGGFIEHPGIDAMMLEERAAASLALGAWQGAVEAMQGPAYPTLLSIESLCFAGEAPLSERDLTGTLAGPAGPLDVALSLQRSSFTDDNARRIAQAYARLPLTRDWALVYAGGITSFAQRSARYWDPIDYTSNALGIELARRAVHGLSFAVRVLPAYARSREAVVPLADSSALSASNPEPWQRTEIATRTALQLGASADLSYRAARWEMAAAVAHGRGRAGGYRRTAASLTIRLLP